MTPFNSRRYDSPNGARVRVDEGPCLLPRRDGTKCTLTRKIIYVEYQSPRPARTKLRSATSTCEHQTLDCPGDLWWSEELIVDLFDRINRGDSFRDIYEQQERSFPAKKFPQPVVKLETREGKGIGSVKEFDCAQRKKYEDVKKNVVRSDAWSEPLSRRNDAYESIDWSNKAGFRAAKIHNTDTQSVFEYDSTSCSCGHERGGHDARGHCIVCKKFCDGAS